MTIWEHRTVFVPDNEPLDNAIDEYGAQGWEPYQIHLDQRFRFNKRLADKGVIEGRLVHMRRSKEK